MWSCSPAASKSGHARLWRGSSAESRARRSDGAIFLGVSHSLEQSSYCSPNILLSIPAISSIWLEPDSHLTMPKYARFRSEETTIILSMIREQYPDTMVSKQGDHFALFEQRYKASTGKDSTRTRTAFMRQYDKLMREHKQKLQVSSTTAASLAFLSSVSG